MTTSVLTAAARQLDGTHPTICGCCQQLFYARSVLAVWCSDACRRRAGYYRRSGRPIPPKGSKWSQPIRPKALQAEIQPLAPFDYQGHHLRVITDDSGVTWFVAADLLDVLDLDRKAMERLDDDEKGVSSIPTSGGHQSMTTVNEPGLYSLILGSRKPEAKAFKRWVTHEVLPAIRRTGSYSTAPAPTLPHGVHVVAKSHRHASFLLNLAVEQHVGAALMCKHVYDCQHHRTPSDIQFHIPAA
jgi:prophage antirepressor-like protein